ncbi:hypothetical protein DERP_013234, partial [Dermatophagoides pteronyssinus]
KREEEKENSQLISMSEKTDQLFFEDKFKTSVSLKPFKRSNDDASVLQPRKTSDVINFENKIDQHLVGWLGLASSIYFEN